MQRALIHAATFASFFFASLAICAGAESDAQKAPAPEIELRHQGLHGYIASRCEKSPIEFRYGAGFYSAVWQLVAQPISDFQIGLPSTWILPDNSDNRTEPLCPVGTIPRDSWPERVLHLTVSFKRLKVDLDTGREIVFIMVRQSSA